MESLIPFFASLLPFLNLPPLLLCSNPAISVVLLIHPYINLWGTSTWSRFCKDFSKSLCLSPRTGTFQSPHVHPLHWSFPFCVAFCALFFIIFFFLLPSHSLQSLEIELPCVRTYKVFLYPLFFFTNIEVFSISSALSFVHLHSFFCLFPFSSPICPNSSCSSLLY